MPHLLRRCSRQGHCGRVQLLVCGLGGWAVHEAPPPLRHRGADAAQLQTQVIIMPRALWGVEYQQK